MLCARTKTHTEVKGFFCSPAVAQCSNPLKFLIIICLLAGFIIVFSAFQEQPFRRVLKHNLKEIWSEKRKKLFLFFKETFLRFVFFREHLVESLKCLMIQRGSIVGILHVALCFKIPSFKLYMQQSDQIPPSAETRKVLHSKFYR